jgi:dihydrolipoamide dehydrogenase
LDYNNLPGCTYCTPEVASVGFTEKAAKEAGYQVKVGVNSHFQLPARQVPWARKRVFVKVIFDARYGEFSGCAYDRYNVTELIAEVVTARKLETTGHENHQICSPASYYERWQ